MRLVTAKRKFKDLPKTKRGAVIVKRFDVAGGREIHDVTTRFGLRHQAQTLYVDQEKCSACGGRCQHCASHLFVDTSVLNIMPDDLRKQLCASDDPLVKKLREYLDGARLVPVPAAAPDNTQLDADQITAAHEATLHEHEALLVARMKAAGGEEVECDGCGQAWIEHPDHRLASCPHCGEKAGAKRKDGEHSTAL